MYIADFHLHSKYSLATSKDMELEQLLKWAKLKGLNLLGSGDFTHPLWYRELKEKLKETNKEGIYNYKGLDFILTTEVSNIYKKDGKTRKIHTIIFISSLEKASILNKKLKKFSELNSNGRPILNIDVKELLKIVKNTDALGFIVPAHIWTPHYSLFGSFDSVEECFEELSDEIFTLETGLGSDPAMNKMVSSLDKYSFISNSDAHSPYKIGREANVFDSPFSFKELKTILKLKDKKRFLFTIEYFSEQGKYYFDGHKNCGICLHPEESKKLNNICPLCGKKITIGVLHRVLNLADRKLGENNRGLIPFKKTLPLLDIVGSLENKNPNTVSIIRKVEDMCTSFESEFSILLNIPIQNLKGKIDNNILQFLDSLRKGKIKIIPGCDGQFGKLET
ncbi:endonuclease Q family protein [bacterium]|nr:endonuclease Q family protein [bacterium]